MTNLPLDIMHEFDLCVKQNIKGRHTRKWRHVGVFLVREISSQTTLYIHLLVEEKLGFFVAHFEEKKNYFSLFKQEQRAGHLRGVLLAQNHPLLN